ncbi:type II secretion system protein [Amycolatopsis sp. NPDC051128]|uniref:type IV pilus modification PilV family protein n=1 Tax=Amycolatopsis sp. NPDC051128 TaxID=3155412 RepID=UPI00342AAA5A
MIGRNPGSANERGETLIELLITITIMGILIPAVMGELVTTILVSDIHRKQATAGAYLHDYAEAIENQVMAGGYFPCAAPAKYAAPAGFTVPEPDPKPFVPSVTSVKYWTGTAWSATCGADSGLQQLTVQVASRDGRASEKLVVVVRKRCGLGEALC